MRPVWAPGELAIAVGPTAWVEGVALADIEVLLVVAVSRRASGDAARGCRMRRPLGGGGIGCGGEILT